MLLHIYIFMSQNFEFQGLVVLFSVYGLACYIRNVIFIYLSFMSFERYLLPKYPSCLICICAGVCFPCIRKNNFLYLYWLYFCGICWSFHAEPLSETCFGVFLITTDVLNIRAVQSLIHHCTYQLVYQLYPLSISSKNKMSMSTSYLAGKKINHNNTKYQKDSLSFFSCSIT